MAKWGEGDPRWIVEERSDGTNVNNWHWWVEAGWQAGSSLTRHRTEKNATEWSKNTLKKLLAGLEFESAGMVRRAWRYNAV